MNVFVKNLFAVALLCLAGAASAVEPRGPVTLSTLATAPLYFEATDPGRFIARGPNSEVLLAPGEATIVLTRPAAGTAVSFRSKDGQRPPMETRSVRLQLEHANPAAKMTGLDQVAGRANYFTGNDPAAWRTGIPLFARVAVDEVYPGIDLIYYADQSARLEYDFVLQPHASPDRISFRIEGADKVRVDKNGDLVLTVGGEEVRQHKPVIYQEIGGARKQIDGGYRLTGRSTVGFWIADYDRALPLVIDPVMSFFAFIGGTKTEYGWAVATDGSHIYVAGETLSKDLVTSPGAFTNLYGGGSTAFGDAFVAKYDTNGANVYLTYFGGRKNDGALAIATRNGSAYVTGFTDSTNFPLTPLGPTQVKTSLNDGARNNNAFRLYPTDAFVAIFNPAGGLAYSTYFGGSGREVGFGIAVDSNDDIYLAGMTESITNFPVTTNIAGGATSVIRGTNSGGPDAFVAKLNAGNSPPLIYATYLGGTNKDYAQSVDFNSSGQVYVTGFTESFNFPVTFTTNYAIGTDTNFVNQLSSPTNSQRDAFITHLSANGATNLFTIYIGGSDDDVGEDIRVFGGNVFVTGTTSSTNFPTNGVISSGSPGFTNFLSQVFVIRLDDSDALSIDYARRFGGNRDAQGTSIDVVLDKVYVAGFTTSTNFFQTNAFTDLRVTNAPVKKSKGFNDGFIAVFDLDGTTFHATNSVMFGSNAGNDEVNGIAVDPSGNFAYVVGHTTSTNLANNIAVPPLFNAGKKSNGKINDAFTGKIDFTLP